MKALFSLLAFLLCSFAAPAKKAVAHVELLDPKNVIVVYTDLSVAVAPPEAFTARGELRPGYPCTIIEAPTSDVLVTTWVDVKGLARRVETNCATMKQIDCVIQHNKMVDLMLQAAPAPKPRDEK